MSKSSFEQLIESLGIWPGYRHAAGHQVTLPRDVAEQLVRAFGVDPSDPEAALTELENRPWQRSLPPVRVLQVGTPRLDLPVVLPSDSPGDTLSLTLHEEQGTARSLVVPLTALDQRTVDGRRLTRYVAAVPLPKQPGYHRLSLATGQSMALIVVPKACFLPESLARGVRSWGFSVQLYGYRSTQNWGIGDFTDLSRLVETSARLGASFVGLNPLHALFLDRPERCTPYSPNSRAQLNVLYLDLLAIPDMAENGPVQALVNDSAFQQRLSALRDAAQLDYPEVAALKLPLLERLFEGFQKRHLSTGSARAKAFEAFVQARGDSLRQFALFEALRERMAVAPAGGGWTPWQNWSAPFRRPDSPEVRQFAAQHGDRINFYLYLQWEADRQLAAAARLAETLPLGLYTDLAVGFDRDGADCWVHQQAVPQGISVGCPPDLRNPLGQDWGVVPFSPVSLADSAYAPFIEMLRATMRHASVIRLDHAFQLLRQYWVPLGRTAREGGYVSYPMDDLMGLIALESHRNQCAVVAEDLGTIPEGFRERIMDKQALSFRVLHRERNADRSYKAPADYPPFALAAPATHDQATLAGFWISRDLQRRRELSLYPSPEAEVLAVEGRQEDRVRLAEALNQYADLSDTLENDQKRPSDAMILAVHRFLARTPSLMTVVQFEDLFNQEEQANMPATIDQHPNWRRRYPREVETLAEQKIVQVVARMMAEEGRGLESTSK
ncbi:4-alpha-glucanotransferase [Magnetospira thiophila]